MKRGATLIDSHQLRFRHWLSLLRESPDWHLRTNLLTSPNPAFLQELVQWI